MWIRLGAGLQTFLSWACFLKVLYLCIVVWVCIQQPFRRLSWSQLLSLGTDGSPSCYAYVREVVSCSAICLKPIFTHLAIVFYNGHGINHFYKNKNKKSEVFGIIPFQVCVYVDA